MSQIKARSAWGGSLLMALALTACTHTVATAPAASTASPRDLVFITDMYNIVEFDRQVIKDELARNGDKRVEELAADLLQQANAFEAKVLPITKRDGIQPPDEVSFARISDHHQRLSAMIATGHYDYDAEFLTDEIASHQRAVTDVEKIVHEPSGDPQLRVLSTEGIIRLRFNLQRLEALQQERLAAK